MNTKAIQNRSVLPLLFGILCSLALLFLWLASATHAENLATPPAPVTLAPAELAAGDGFGAALALEGDLLAVGAWLRDVNGNEGQGAVYLFARDANNPLLFHQIKLLTASDGKAFEQFGQAVAIAGDTVVVGAPHADTNGFFDSGAAYVFERNHGGADAWGQVAKLVDANFSQYSEHGYLGQAVAISGDTVVVGAPRNRGRAIVFGRNQGGANAWGEVQVLGPPNYWERGSFGVALAFDGQRLAVGGSAASMVPGRYNNEGAVFLFQHDGTAWAQVAKLAVADNDPNTPYANNSRFGAALSLVGETLFVGAPAMQLNDLYNVGQVFVFQHDIPNGRWDLVDDLTASDGGELDGFGRALYATAAGVFIASAKGTNDTVYFFQQDANAATTATPAGWTEQYSFSVTENVVGSNFGNVLTGGANTLAVGSVGYNSSRGAVFLYPLDSMVSPQPTTTPVSTPVASPTPSPTPPGTTVENRIYLPAVANPPKQAPLAMTGVLTNSAILSGLVGVKLGALENSLLASTAVTMSVDASPLTPLPSGVTPRSDFYRLAAERNVFTTLSSPLILALPIPAGADAAHLALAYLAPADGVLDSGSQAADWDFLPGVYDAERGRFLTTLPFLTTSEIPLLLVEHAGFSSPPNGTMVQHAATVGAFTVQCDPTQTFPCTHEDELDTAGALNAAYERMTGTQGFPPPRLLTLIGAIDEGDQFSLVSASGYTALIKQGGVKFCERSDGYYQYWSGKIVLCLYEGRGVDEDAGYSLLHEYFHATQYAYDRVLRDAEAGVKEAWIIEGTAAAAMKSIYDTRMQRIDRFALHTVDTALTAGVWGDTSDIEYSAQDFWVGSGQAFGRDLTYLQPIFANGGATTNGVKGALETEFGLPFAALYWGWVKNQVIEKRFDLGGGLGPACELNTAALTPPQAPIVFAYHPQEQSAYPITTTFASLAPLHATVVEIDFPETTTTAVVEINYQECDGLTDPAQIDFCRAAAQRIMHSKIYVQGEANCHLHALPGVPDSSEGSRALSPGAAGDRYFVVVANGDLTTAHGFQIFIEGN